MTGHNKPRWFVTMSWLGVGGCCWPAAPGGPHTFLCNLLRERERETTIMQDDSCQARLFLTHSGTNAES